MIRDVMAVLILASCAGAQSGIVRIDLPDAKARALAASKAKQLAMLNIAAAKYHRQAIQADYFPKLSATFFNLHFNKFMGQEFELFRLNHTVTLPLVDKDQTLVLATAVQPITPILKIRQVVSIARADERIARAKADAAAAQVATDVEHAYYSLLIAQRRQAAAEIRVNLQANPPLTRVVAASTSQETAGRPGVPILDAARALVIANSQVAELRQALNALLTFPLETQLDLVEPPAPAIENVSADMPAQSIDHNPDVLEARNGVDKARAAARLAKLDYVPDVAGLWGYSVQTIIPALPHDFSFVGVSATWTIFDFGKRERTIQERNTQVRMAETNLELVRAKVSATVQKAALDMQRARRIAQLTRQVAVLSQAGTAGVQPAGMESRAASAEAEADLYQAELDYLLAYAELKRSLGRMN
jgi:outer membrane protein TolC